MQNYKIFLYYTRMKPWWLLSYFTGIPAVVVAIPVAISPVLSSYDGQWVDCKFKWVWTEFTSWDTKTYLSDFWYIINDVG